MTADCRATKSVVPGWRGRLTGGSSARRRVKPTGQPAGCDLGPQPIQGENWRPTRGATSIWFPLEDPHQSSIAIARRRLLPKAMQARVRPRSRPFSRECGTYRPRPGVSFNGTLTSVPSPWWSLRRAMPRIGPKRLQLPMPRSWLNRFIGRRSTRRRSTIQSKRSQGPSPRLLRRSVATQQPRKRHLRESWMALNLGRTHHSRHSRGQWPRRRGSAPCQQPLLHCAQGWRAALRPRSSMFRSWKSWTKRQVVNSRAHPHPKPFHGFR